MRRIFAHRGLWGISARQNSDEALQAAFSKRFAVETDLRIRDSRLSVMHNHDSPVSKFEIADALQAGETIAINIKEDGIFNFLQPEKEFIFESGSFLFDGSIPEMRNVKNAGLPHALRISEFESEIPWKSEFIWLDSFESDWWLNDKNTLRILSEERVIVVSPELHGRNHMQVWEVISKIMRETNPQVSICTDFPELFQELL